MRWMMRMDNNPILALAVLLNCAAMSSFNPLEPVLSEEEFPPSSTEPDDTNIWDLLDLFGVLKQRSILFSLKGLFLFWSEL